MIGRLFCASLLALTLAAAGAHAQTRPGAAPATPPAAAAPEPAKDALGRGTPRSTVVGFLTAARNGDDDLARYYLNTPLGGPEAEQLAHQLFVVLDMRLPARLTQMSDDPEGSRANPLVPDQETIGTIEISSGKFDIVLQRIKKPKAAPIWLFSSATLEAIPAAYDEIAGQLSAPRLPRFISERRVGGVRLVEWLTVLLGLPAFYFLTVLLNRALTPLVAWLGRRVSSRIDGTIRDALPGPARVLLLCVASRWLFSFLPLSLPVRQLISNAANVMAIGALTWLAMFLNGKAEGYAVRRIRRADQGAAASLLHVGRRTVDGLVVLAGLLGILRHFGVDPTPLLAGLGVGGIAVALAAQKTLENVIAGASLIVDQAVRVGDFLKAGELVGTVDHIGLRSTRIRTLDRSIVSVPNSQIANMSLETLSARDKFWLHPVVGLRYETTTEQMHRVLDGIRQMLAAHAAVETGSIRVRFLRLGASSLDVEVVAYLLARDWEQFLELQEELLLGVTEIVQAAGTAIAFPSQTMYLEGAGTAAPAAK